MNHFGTCARRALTRILWGAGALYGCVLAPQVRAGGSGLNTVVVVNQSSAHSLEAGNYYCERRQVPPDNFLRITWPVTGSGTNVSWNGGDLQTNLVNPLLSMLASRQLTNQIDYVVLSMDIPYQTINTTLINGTTAALFYGLKLDYGPTWPGVTNSYFASEQVFSRARPASAPGYSFLTTMITGNSVADAKRLIDQGVNSDGTFPAQTVLLAKSSDPLRNIRYSTFDNAIFNTRLSRGPYTAQRTNCDSIWGITNLFGFETGLAYQSISPNTFVPGAMADSLTSFGGQMWITDQTTVLAFTGGGAAGSYGTVTEPSPVAAKFPNPQNYFYQARGFSLAECYYQSLLEPYEGLVVGEPLAAPCQRLAAGQWAGIGSNAVLKGTAQAGLQFAATDVQHPLQQIDLLVDGKFLRTLTNVAPAAGNVLTVSLNGYSSSYTVPPNSTLATIAAGIADLLNAPTNSGPTRTAAFAHGDRVEIHSVATNSLDNPVFFGVATTNASARFYRVVYLPQPAAPALSTAAWNAASGFKMHIEAAQASPFVVQASTNLAQWTSLVTNLAGGPLDFVDTSATALARRFYRAMELPPAVPEPALAVSKAADGSVRLQVSGALAPFTVQSSSDLAQWVTAFTNLTVGGTTTATGAAKGSASALSSFVAASQNSFLDSQAQGIRGFTVNGTLQPGTWLQLAVTKTNGTTVTVPITNQVTGAAIMDMATSLVNAVNSNSALRGPDGVVIQDLAAGFFGAAGFNLLARGAGEGAAAVGCALTGSSSLVLSPTNPSSLTQNLSDLQPRNHLYVTAGATNLALGFSLDTTSLTDGFHELTAVAYEGSDVRTQTRATLPVMVKNTALTAALNLLDLPDTASVQGTYHLQVTANARSTTVFHLLSNGGELGALTNIGSATFTVSGPFLGAGRIPLYAVVQSAAGATYRTPTHFVVLTNAP